MFACFGDDEKNPPYVPPVVETQEEKVFNKFVSRIETLENLSKAYNQTDYINRALVFIRSERYNDSTWNMLCGADDTEFFNYVQTNQGTNNLIGLRTVSNFVIPKTNEKVDFVHMIATMNTINKNPIDTNSHDLSGWGGDLCQLVQELKDSTLTGQALLNLAKQKLNAESSSFGNQDMCADLDAVNIMKIYQNNQSISLSQTIKNYYKNITVVARKQQFLSNVFSSQTLTKTDLISKINQKIEENVYLSFWCLQNGINMTTHKAVFDACTEAFAEFLIG